MVRTPLYCPRLVGRDGELSALVDLARRAAGGESIFAFVSGDAGAGKTRLIAELRRHLPRGMRGLYGMCMEYAPSPMGSVLDIVNALDAHGEMPAGDVPAAAAADDDPAGKRRLFERVIDALRRAASAGPFAMILDDAQWADSATVDLLQFLIGTLHGARVLILVAYRTDEVGAAHPLQSVVARAMRARDAAHVELEPLSQAHVQELIDATLPQELRLAPESLRELRDRSEGNPLFAEELLKTMADGLRAGRARMPLPASLRGLLLERLRRVAPEELRLFETAALIGRRFSADFLARIAGRETSALAPFLRSAVEQHFLVEDRDNPGWFAFRHALTRDTILSGVLALHARELHVAIAREVEREPLTGTRVLELAEHYWRAGSFTECAGYAEQAGDLAKGRHAYAEAAGLYERAIACAIADEPGLVMLHAKAASAYASLGEPQKVLEHLEVAEAYYATTRDTSKLIAVYLEQALAFRRTAQPERSLNVLRRAAALSRSSGNEKLLLETEIQLAQEYGVAERWSRTEAHLRSAEPLLPLASPRDEVRFHTWRATLHLSRLELAEWRRDSERAVDVARGHGDPTVLAFALTGYGIGARKVGQFGVALGAFREAVEAGRSYGALYTVTFAQLVHLNVLYLTGDLAGARAELLDVLGDLYDAVKIRFLVAQFGVALSIALRDEALLQRCYSPEVLEAAFATGEAIQFAPLAATIAEHHLAAGDERAASALLERMLASLPDGWDDCEALLPVAVCCSQADVERTRERFAVAAARGRNPFVEAYRGLYDAYAAARFGTRDAKMQHAKAAASLLRQLGMPLLEAEAYELAEQPARAVALCEAIGARRLPRRLEPQPRRRSAATQLTAREREVVEFALRSLTNSAIADELSLSERTVEAHMAAAYRKLGVRSRAELLNVLARP